eukprot:492883_1
MASRKRKRYEIDEEPNRNISEMPKKKKCIRTNNDNEQQTEFQININNNNNNINNLQEFSAMDFNTHNNNQTNTNNKMECSDSDSESDDYEDLEIPDHMSRGYHVGPVTNLETLTFSDHVAEFMEVPGSDTEPNEIIEIKSNDSAKDTPNNQLFLILSKHFKVDGMKFTNTRHVNDIDSTEIDSNDDNIDNIYNLTTDNITVNGIKYMLKQDKYTKVTERRNVFCVTINKKSGFVAKVFPCCDMKACKAVKREWDMLILLKNNINTINPCLASLYNPCMEPYILAGIIITQRFGINMV